MQDINQNEAVANDPEIDDPQDYYYLNHTLTTNQPETLDVVKEWRNVVDQYPDRSVERNKGIGPVCREVSGKK